MPSSDSNATVTEDCVVDMNLFAGAGGLAVGLVSAGFGPLEMYEVRQATCDTLRHNTGPGDKQTIVGVVHKADVTTVDWRKLRKPVRLLAGGAPCQPFSLAGKKLAEDDGRNLFPEFLRAVRLLRPSAVLLENVQGLLREAVWPYFTYILEQLETPSLAPRRSETWRDHRRRLQQHRKSLRYRPDYLVQWRLVDAADYGVPQNRKRVVIVATQHELGHYRFAEPTHSRKALLSAQSRRDYWDERDVPGPSELPTDPGTDGLLPWVTVRDALRGLGDPSQSEDRAEANHWVIPGARSYPGHSGSTMDWPAKTIKAGVNGVAGGENTILTDDGNLRYMTLREAARLQSFPDTHYFLGPRSEVTRQIGNAVPPKLATALAKPLVALLEQAERRGSNAGPY